MGKPSDASDKSLFPVADFYKAFVLPSIMAGQPFTPENVLNIASDEANSPAVSPTYSDMRSCSVKLLQSLQISPKDATIFETKKHQTIHVSKMALETLMDYIESLKRNSAASTIQRVWRSHKTNSMEVLSVENDSSKYGASNDGVAAERMPLRLSNTLRVVTSKQQQKTSESGQTRSDKTDSSESYPENVKITSTVTQNVWVPTEQDRAACKLYIKKISSMYSVVLNSKRATKSLEPTEDELKFLQILNSCDSYNTAKEFDKLVSIIEKNGEHLMKVERFYAGSKEGLENTYIMYLQYSRKIIDWLNATLKLKLDLKTDLISILRDGRILCQLICCLYPETECHLFEKDTSFSIHRIVFFLELCKSLYIKRSLLFSVSNLLLFPDEDPARKDSLIVLRTVLALEKHALKGGWKGPVINSNFKISHKPADDIDKSNQPPGTTAAVAPSLPSNDEKKLDQKIKALSIKDSKSNRNAIILGESRGTDIVKSAKTLARRNVRSVSPQKPVPIPILPEVSKSMPRIIGKQLPKTPSDSPAFPVPSTQPNKSQAVNQNTSLEIHTNHSVGSDVTSVSPISKASTYATTTDQSMVSTDAETSLSSANPVSETAIQSPVDTDHIKECKKQLKTLYEREEEYTQNLVNVRNYIAVQMKRRNKLLKSLSLDDTSPVLPAQEEPKEKEGAQKDQLKKQTKIQPKADETEDDFKERIQTEVDELRRLYQVVDNMSAVHGLFLTDLRPWISPGQRKKESELGEMFKSFAERLVTPYTTYSVITLIGINEDALLDSDKEGILVMREIMKKYAGKRAKTETTGQIGPDVMVWGWQWYIEQPLKHISTYSPRLDRIATLTSTTHLDVDYRKIRLASVKIKSLFQTISEALLNKAA